MQMRLSIDTSEDCGLDILVQFELRPDPARSTVLIVLQNDDGAESLRHVPEEDAPEIRRERDDTDDGGSLPFEELRLRRHLVERQATALCLEQRQDRAVAVDEDLVERFRRFEEAQCFVLKILIFGRLILHTIFRIDCPRVSGYFGRCSSYSDSALGR